MRKKITVGLVGGLGNQLHCYAIGRAIAASNNADLIVDTESGYWHDPYRRKYELRRFPMLHVHKLSRKIFPGYRILFKIKRKLSLIISHYLPYKYKIFINEGSSTYYQTNLVETTYKFCPYFIGYWACHRYYSEIEDILRKELIPPIPKATDALELLAKIESTNSCMVHWRSYVEEVGGRKPVSNSYYADALRMVETSHPDIQFFAFSDRPDLMNEALGSNQRNITIVNLSSIPEDDRSFAEFYLMFRCNHAIIGDSTFSWWAAWLGYCAGKLVIAPGGVSPWGKDWIPPTWKTIPAQRS